MRRLLVIAAALGMMWSLHELGVSDDSAQFDPLTLAAIGFVVLTAYIMGELGAKLGLPKVTGYILSGVVLGPGVSDILSVRVVEEMRVFNDLALGLIATSAGLELDLRAIRQVWRTLSVTVATKIPALILLVGGTFWVVQTFFHVLDIQGEAAIWGLALIFGVLGLGTSPAIALAVVRETGSKGRLSDLVLAIAVVKDLVVVVCLALALAVVRSMLDPEGSLDAHVLLQVGEEIGLSLAVGTLIGAVLILYLRYVRAEMLLFVTGTVLLTTELSAFFHLELLLVLITAGFMVRNLSKYEHDLMKPLSRVSLPVFVVFFTTAGAGVDLGASLAVLPMALALALARALAFGLAGLAGGRAGHESPKVAGNAWMAYLPQAGVTLGLVLLAAEAIPELAEQIRRIGMALVALHLLIGPVLMSLALRRAGEVPGKGAAAEPVATAEETAPVTTTPPTEIDLPIEQEAEAPAVKTPRLPSPTELTAELHDEKMADLIRTLGHGLEERAHRFVTDQVDPLASFGERTGLYLLDRGSLSGDVAETVATALEWAPPETPGRWEDEILALYAELAGLIQSLPEEVLAPLRDDQLLRRPAEGSSTWLRRIARRWARRLGRRSGSVRRVQVRRIARVTLEGRLAETLAVLDASWFRTYGLVLRRVRDAVEGLSTAEQTRLDLTEACRDWRRQVEAELIHALRVGLSEMAGFLDEADSPASPASRIRYSKIEPRVRAALDRIDADRRPWRIRVSAAFDALRASVAVEASSRALERFTESHGRAAMDVIHDQLLPGVVMTANRLEALAREVKSGTVHETEAIQNLLQRVHDAFDDRQRSRIRRARVEYRRRTRKSQLLEELAAIAKAAPARLELVDSRTRLSEATRPEWVQVVALELSRELEHILTELMFPTLTSGLTSVGTIAATCDGRLREAIHIATYGIEFVLRGKLDEASARQELLTAALERSARRCRDFAAELDLDLGETSATIEQQHQAAQDRLNRLMRERRGATELLRTEVESRSRALIGAINDGAKQVRRSFQTLFTSARQGLTKQHRLQDWLIQTGQQHLDAAEMGRISRERLPAPKDLALPTIYRELFSTAPVDDRRLIAARKAETEQTIRMMLSAKERWGNIMILGAPGSGRSSFLNEIEYRLADHRTIRIEEAFHLRSEGLLGALVAELGCARGTEALAEALRDGIRAVLIDDLEHFVTPSQEGLADLEGFLRAVVDSSSATQWVITTSREALDTFDVVDVPMREVFTRQVELEPIGWREVAAAVEARHRLAGVKVRYTMRGDLSGRLRGLWRQSVQERYFRALTRVSEGNLRTALLTHLWSVRAEPQGDGLRTERPQRPTLAFLGQLESAPLALLASLVRFGPMYESELAAILRTSPVAVRSHLLLLERALLVERTGETQGGLVAIPPHIENALVAGLTNLQLLQEVV
jgi:Kef-type K+ transport system membrane component KefB